MYFDKKLIANDEHVASQWRQLEKLRQEHEGIQANALKAMGQTLVANQAALIPTDAYRELDNITKTVLINDEGQGYMQDLMDIQKGVDIGKTAYLYRQASDKTGKTVRSMSGQNPEMISKTDYVYDGDPVPIFTDGYGREWREQKAFQTEGFDAMFDDHYNAMRNIKEDMAIYMLTGDTNINVRGYAGEGILNHRNTQKINLGAAGDNINLVTATPEEILAYFETEFAQELDDNYCMMVDKFWVSPQMRRSFKRRSSSAAQFKEGTIEERILAMGRIGSIETTYELGRSVGPGEGDYNAAGQGNEFFCYVKNQQHICPIVGQAVSTIAVPRIMPMDNLNNMIWGAMGMQVRDDRNGRSKVFYASEVS